MANYFCTDSVEEQVDYLTDKVKDLKTTKLDKAAIVQEAGTGTEVVMSQKVVTDALGGKLDKTAVVQASGTGTDVVMSQKAVTDGFASKTDLNSKLTKPANPSAESAVTMLADGTVGTKPLSEIGSGGGKLYRHHISVVPSSVLASIFVDIINTSPTPMSQSEFQTYVHSMTVAVFTGMNGSGVVNISYDNLTGYLIKGAVLNTQDTGTGYFVNLTETTFDNLTDTVTEL